MPTSTKSSISNIANLNITFPTSGQEQQHSSGSKIISSSVLICCKEEQKFGLLMKVSCSHFSFNMIKYYPASTHFWEKRPKIWMDMNQPFSLKLRPKRGKGAAILGGISSHSNKLVYYIAQKSETSSVKQMLIKLVNKSQDPRNTVIVLDRASYHRNPENVAYLQRKGVGILYLPPSSSGKFLIICDLFNQETPMSPFTLVFCLI